MAEGLLDSSCPQHLVLRARAALSNAFVVEDEASHLVGRITPDGWLRRTTTIRLPEALPLAVQAFLPAVVIVEWKRASEWSA